MLVTASKPQYEASAFSYHLARPGTSYSHAKGGCLPRTAARKSEGARGVRSSMPCLSSKEPRRTTCNPLFLFPSLRRRWPPPRRTLPARQAANPNLEATSLPRRSARGLPLVRHAALRGEVAASPVPLERRGSAEGVILCEGCCGCYEGRDVSA